MCKKIGVISGPISCYLYRTAPLRPAPHRSAPHRTAPHRTAPQRTAQLALYQPTDALNKCNKLQIEFVSSIKLLHVAAPECCHLQEVFYYKDIQVQHANPGIKANGTCIALFWCLPEVETCSSLILATNFFLWFVLY